MSEPLPVNVSRPASGADLTAGRKARIAVGVFDRLENLALVLDSLTASDESQAALMVLAGPCAFGGRLGGTGAAPLPGCPRVVLTDGGAAEAGSSIDRLVHLEDWLEPRLARRLRQNLSEGAGLLFLTAEPPERERRVCDLLLRHGSGPVQVHDVLL